MNLALLQTCINKKVSRVIQCLLILSQCRPFSVQNLKQKTQNKKLDGALRVLDIISAKPNVHTNRKNHLRLIQDFLQTESKQSSSLHSGDDFGLFSSKEGVSSVFEEILEFFTVNKDSQDSAKDNLRRYGCGSGVSVLSNAVSSCGSSRNLRGGVGYHCLIIRTGFVANVYVGTSLINMYGKCSELESAYKVFEEMPLRNVFSWTALISGFAQEWQVDMCLGLYSMMRKSTANPNDFTLTSILSACTGSGALGQGRSAHCQTIQMGFDSYLHIANALISMYSKCGSLEEAFYIFNNMLNRDVVSWNSMIAGYAQHGLAAQAINLFKQMKRNMVKPDAITFLAVLSSCRHAGLVEEGKVYFNSMVEHGVKPELDHYSCVVDLFGRAGLVEEARNFIQEMPIYPNAILWGSLLSSCRLHGAVWTGIHAAECRLLLEPECAATHVQLVNLYASVGYWDQAARLRKLMKDRGLRTNPGCSWIEIKNEVYRFKAEDVSNCRPIEILTLLDDLMENMRTLGYQPEACEEEVDDGL